MLGGGCCATRRYSSLPALSFFPSIEAPSHPTFLLSLTDEISTSDQPTDRCFDKISESPFTKRQADRPTDRRMHFFTLTRGPNPPPTDRPTDSWSGGQAVDRSVGRLVPLSIKIISFSWSQSILESGDRPTDGNRDGGRKKREEQEEDS